jgi:hypothetical protein
MITKGGAAGAWELAEITNPQRGRGSGQTWVVFGSCQGCPEPPAEPYTWPVAKLASAAAS